MSASDLWKVRGVDHREFSDSRWEVRVVVGDEAVGPASHGGGEMHGVGSTKPIGRPQGRCQLGRGPVDRQQVQASEKSVQLGQFIGGFGACRLGQEFWEQEDRADPCEWIRWASRAGREEGAHPHAKGVAIDSGVDQDISVKGVQQADGRLPAGTRRAEVRQ